MNASPLALLSSSVAAPTATDSLASVGLLGLIGVVVGALIAAAAQVFAAWFASHRTKKLRQQERLTALVADLWSACEALRKKRDELTYVADAIMVSRHGNQDREGAVELESRRQDCFKGIRSAEADSGRALALIRIEFPSLTPPATHLSEAAAKSGGKIESLSARLAEYKEAREAFEVEARTLLERTR